MPESNAVLRRHLLRTAVLAESPASAAHATATRFEAAPRLTGAPPHTVVSGVVADAGPHLLTLTAPDGRALLHLPLTATTSIWYGGDADIAALRPGRHVIARRSAPDGPVDRIWVDIARVTGTITEYGRSGGEHTADIDTGPHRTPQRVTFPSESWEKVRVRHPRFRPGEPADVIGLRSADGTYVLACGPASAQPSGDAVRARARRPARPHRPLPAVLTGTITWWWDPAAVDDRGGAAYPALDPAGDGAECQGPPPSCVRLPYLSLGSRLRVRNECRDVVGTVPVTACGCVARRFCDRCTECGPSPRGRLAELSPVHFAALGGELSRGCFNGTVGIG